ncbi:MAG: hypothetical protein JWP63_6473 [Candidatus Solibacter sp.]|nr:hypothetical protein [Candidatus Solibacter sp.]
MARKCLLLLFLCAPLCHAQLATTNDGRQLLLTTYWRLTDEPFESQHYGIYRATDSHWTPVIHTDQGPVLSRPFLSGDGSVIAWDRSLPGFGGIFGNSIPRTLTQFQGLTAPASIGTYNLTLSRNARFVLSPGYLGLVDFILLDLSTGRQYTTPEAPTLRTFGVANDGSVIGLAATRNGITNSVVPNRVIVWRPDTEPREIFRSDSVWNLWISADGARALIETRTPARELWWVDIASGNRQRLAQLAPDSKINFLDQINHQISNDGSRVLYVWPSQNTMVWYWQTGANPRPLAQADEGFLSAVLSGDGRIAWALTATGRLLRITIDTGTTDEVLPALPPRLDWGYAGTAPGSAMIFRGGSSPGLRFTVGDLTFPVIDETSTDSIAIEIPWEANPQTAPMIVHRDGDPFELAFDAFVERGIRPVIAGQTDERGNYQLKAAQQDFSALVTAANPAPAGSTIHTWFYNLGPLDRPVATGAPGPDDPPAKPLAPLGCFILTAPGTPGRGLEIPFLAYAPGLIGVYQADLIIPADWPAGNALLICDVKGAATSAWLPVSHP